MKTIMVTGADRGLGYSLCENLLKRGNRVIAGSYMPEWKQLKELQNRYQETLLTVPIDISKDESVRCAALKITEQIRALDWLINCAGVDGRILDIREGYDYASMLRTYNINALGTLRVTEALLPLLDLGRDKKICCISSEAGSIGACWRENETEYCMSKAALNMGMVILSNRLKKDGYDIRLYHPGWMNTYMMGTKEEHADLEPEDAAELAIHSFERERGDGVLYLESYDGTRIPW